MKLRPEDNEQKVYREVNSLSRVSHQYIVRYYSCWLEDANPHPPDPSTDSSTPSGRTRTASGSDEDIFAINFEDVSSSRRDQSRTASFPRIRFANSGEEDEQDSDDSDTESSSSAETAADPSDARSRLIPIGPRPSMSTTDSSTDGGAVQRILYIQMEFVEKVRGVR